MRAYIDDIARHEGQQVTVNGWLHNRRSSGKIHFLIVRDGTGFIQAVMSKAAVGDEAFATAGHLSQETSLSVTGTVRADARAKGGYEMDVASIEVHGEAHDYPITPKEHGVDYLLDRRHLWIRSERQTAILRVRHEVIDAVRDFFNSRGFILCDTPIFTPAACEGTTTLFPVQYFEDTTAFLTQSGQLYNEANAMALGKVYAFGPTFRAEKSKTRRHLTEFWMVEPEMAYADLNDVIELAEGLIASIVARVLDKRRTELQILERDTAKLESITAPFPRLTYDQAAALLTEKGQPFEYGTDLGGTDETVLSEHFDRPVCITHYPGAVKAFYMKPDPVQPDKALCVDVLAPEGYGEIIGGGQRLDDLDLLMQRIKEHDLPQDAFEWYLDLRRYGTVPHGGFGMGIERCVSWICKLEHVRETIPYPRMLYRLYSMKIGMLSLGCPKNLVDSEVMLGLAQSAGHELTADAASADVLVVNTCAFIDKAKKESIDAILEMAAHKKTGRCRTLVVAGCMAERYSEELKAQIPEIDAVLGTGDVPEILSVLDAAGVMTEGGPRVIPLLRANGEAIGSKPVAAEARALPTYLYDADTPRLLATPRHYAYVKIAEGCDYACAFCIIPTLRGHYRSRPAESIVREAASLAARGVKELLLISQDTSFYGVDRRERGALGRLLRTLNQVEGLEWIRMLYLYPTTIGDDVLDAMADCDKVCAYIDLPLQHASDAVLKRMKRPGTRRGYEALLNKIRTRVPGVTLRTTFIVGFPGETEADVAELQRFIEDMQFDHLGVFTYSHEEGTSAHGLADDVPPAVKRRRQANLMRLQKRIVRHRQRSRVGQRVRVLIDGPSSEHELVLRGRLEGQAPDIDSLVYLTDCDPAGLDAGAFIEGEIVGTRDYDLLVRPLSVTAAV